MKFNFFLKVFLALFIFILLTSITITYGGFFKKFIEPKENEDLLFQIESHKDGDIVYTRDIVLWGTTPLDTVRVIVMLQSEENSKSMDAQYFEQYEANISDGRWAASIEMRADIMNITVISIQESKNVIKKTIKLYLKEKADHPKLDPLEDIKLIGEAVELKLTLQHSRGIKSVKINFEQNDIRSFEGGRIPQIIRKTYKEPGIYIPSLTITNEDGTILKSYSLIIIKDIDPEIYDLWASYITLLREASNAKEDKEKISLKNEAFNYLCDDSKEATERVLEQNPEWPDNVIIESIKPAKKREINPFIQNYVYNHHFDPAKYPQTALKIETPREGSLSRSAVIFKKVSGEWKICFN